MFLRVGLLTGIAIAVGLMPLTHTSGTYATAAETGLPRIQLNSLKNIRKAFEWIAQGRKFEAQLPKQNASQLARVIAKHREKIKDLAHELVSHGDWACQTADYLETYDLINHDINASPSDNALARVLATNDALTRNNAGAHAGGDLVDALEGLSDGAIRETIVAACN